MAISQAGVSAWGESSSPPITFVALGGGDEIGASCYFVSMGGRRLLVDCGIRPIGDRRTPRWHYLYHLGLLDSLRELDAIVLTHAHADHAAGLVHLPEEAWEVPIYATRATRDLVLEQLPSWLGGGDRVVKASCLERLSQIRGVDWEEPVVIGNVEANFFPAGHVLGAAMIRLHDGARGVLFSGDFSSFDQLTVPAYSLPESLLADLLVLETTYGYRESVPAAAVRQERQQFLNRIGSVLMRGGQVLIPAFALGRAQELARILYRAMLHGDLPARTIFMDGAALGVARRYEQHGCTVLDDLVRPAPSWMRTDLPMEPCIIISSSGTLAAGSVSAHYAELLLPNPRNAIVYSEAYDEERAPLVLPQQRSRMLRLNGRELPARAEIFGYRLSLHADYPGLIGLVDQIGPDRVIFIHGEPQEEAIPHIGLGCHRLRGGTIRTIQAINHVPLAL